MLKNQEQMNKKHSIKQMAEVSYEMAKLIGGGEKGKHSVSGDVQCEGSNCRADVTYQYKW